MSDDHGEKRFDATPSRRQRAKREGNAARSHEVASIASFGGALLGVAAALPLLNAAAPAALRASVSLAPRVDPSHLLAPAALAFAPAACAALAGTALSLAQSGGLHLTAVTLDFGKLAPLPGLKRMFGMQAAVAAARAGAAFAVVLLVVAPIGIRAVAAASASTSTAAAAGVAFAGLMDACFAAAGIGALFALADYAVVRRRWLQSLKMTFDEFKRDAKEQDGDPQAKSRRKQLHRTLVRSGIARTSEASFVVVNPTHIAIALRYAPPLVPVPEILVRAADAAAFDVRAIAERVGIPVLEDIALARLLWRCGEAGRPIPPESFVAVATAIAALIRAGVLTA
jgi:flagellar biosynthesis protein FlhB